MAMRAPKSENIQPLKNREDDPTRRPEHEQLPPEQRRSTGEDLLKHAGTWVGDDFKECLEIVKATRGLARF